MSTIKDQLKKVKYITKYGTMNTLWCVISKITKEYVMIDIPGNGEIPIKIENIVNKDELL